MIYIQQEIGRFKKICAELFQVFENHQQYMDSKQQHHILI